MFGAGIACDGESLFGVEPAFGVEPVCMPAELFDAAPWGWQPVTSMTMAKVTPRIHMAEA